VRSQLPILTALGASIAALTLATSARADTSAWVSVGAGALGAKQASNTDFGLNAALSFDFGVGTTPNAPFIFGGLFRIQPLIGQGTDLAFLARAATGGFQSGNFGVALDAGTYLRTWGATTTAGFTGALTLGLPLGFQISAQTMIGPDNAVAVGAIAGIDLLRLTLYRRNFLNYWQNPSPGGSLSARTSHPTFEF